MINKNPSTVNRPYIIIVLALTLILPLISCFTEKLSVQPVQFSIISSFGKWFIFYAVGLRLFIAGIRQTTKPAFTAQQIFQIQGAESYPVIIELGFANLCFGLIGIISLFLPGWRIVSAFGSGLYYGMAGLLHLIKKPAGANERFAMLTDLFIFLLLASYILLMC
jgi:hypothetical protein